VSRRFLAAGIAGAAIAAGAVASPVQPAAAAYDGAEDLSGNFVEDERDEVFSYVVGETADFLLSFSNGGVPGGELTFESFEFRVTGAYDPMVGNFDGDPYDEIFWYSPSGADSVWNFTSWTTRTTVPYQVSAPYDPVSGDFDGDGIDDILWYRPGTGADFVWYFNADGTYTSMPYRVDGTYTPIAGSFGSNQTDDVFWYRPGTGADFVWDFNADTSFSSRPVVVSGTYQPFVLDIFNDGWQGDDIFWFAPGSGADSLWDFYLGQFSVLPEQVTGTYSTSAGDYLGDGHDDILWVGGDGFSLWDHSPTPDGLQRFIYDFRALAAAGAATTSAADATAAETAGSTAGVAVPATSAGAVESGHR
jgi:hypothetical protein